MNKDLVIYIFIVSIILGLILGCLAPIPIAGLFMLLFMLFLSAPVVMTFLIMAGKLDLTSPKDSIITGVLVGLGVNLSFSNVFAMIIYLMLKAFNFTTNIFLSAMIVNSQMWLVFLFIGFLGVLSATTNAFSGFITYYVINFIRDMYEKKHPELRNNQDYNSEQ